jgi:hypothetical protein
VSPLTFNGVPLEAILALAWWAWLSERYLFHPGAPLRRGPQAPTDRRLKLPASQATTGRSPGPSALWDRELDA